MNVPVTGATRVIGRQAIPCMLAAGHEVAGLARSLLAPVGCGSARSWASTPSCAPA